MGVLLDAVKSDYEPGKAFVETFSKIADLNFKRQKDEAADQEKLASFGLRQQLFDLKQQEFALKSTGQEILNRQREQHNIEVNNKQQEALNFTKAVQAATKDGKTLYERLYSGDPAESEEAFHEFSQIRTDFPNLNNAVVQRGIEKMSQAPVVVAKQKLAQQKQAALEASRAVNAGQRQQKIDESVTHNFIMEGQGQQKADTGSKKTDAYVAGVNARIGTSDRKKALDQGEVKFPDNSKMTYDEIRLQLAKGAVSDLDGNPLNPSAIDKTNAQVLSRKLQNVPTGAKDAEQKSIMQTLPINQWRQEGLQMLQPPPAAPTAPAAAPAPAPGVPSAPVAPPPSASPDDFLRRSGVRVQPASQADPTPSGDILETTQNFLANLGIEPAQPVQPVGFGGFGLPS